MSSPPHPTELDRTPEEDFLPTSESQYGHQFSFAPIEITLRNEDPTKRKRDERSEKSKKLHADRILRVQTHKFHTICLLKSACIRNQWINDDSLHARLLSITPLPVQNVFSSITKKRIPDDGQRGRLFESAIVNLVEWWQDEFNVKKMGHIRNCPYGQTQKYIEPQEFEVLRSPKSLIKRLVLRNGSRDCSAILFAALCRALSIPARLIVSLQPVPWQAKAGKPTEKKPVDIKGKAKAGPSDHATDDDDEDEDDMEEVGIPALPEETTSSSPQVSISSAVEDSPKLSRSASPQRHTAEPGHARKKKRVHRTSSRIPILPITGGSYPTIWVEVFSRPDSRWIPVDPIRGTVNRKRNMEPPSYDMSNRMVYVIALEEDGYVRDVTRRYASDYITKTLKMRVGVRNGQQEWWSEVMSLLSRPYRLRRDEIEDDELRLAQHRVGMPNSIAGFKSHPLYVLERHLKQTEVVFPKEEIGIFRGEPVYSRVNVLSLKTSENWTRMGRKVKEGCQPLKMIKAHAMTINRRRAIEMARSTGEELGMQGLYAYDQTELYVPDPVVDGKVPKNEYGNIDLYTPSMLPKGGVHIPFSGVAKIARNLGVDYAEAVTSFEFRHGRAFPVLTGIVVAAENEEMVIETYLESAQNEEEKRRIRTREKVLKLWSKLVSGLRIQQRIQEEYGGKTRDEKVEEPESNMPAGGFLIDADRSVAPFTLPKPITSFSNPDMQQPASPTENEGLIGFDFSLTPALPFVGAPQNEMQEGGLEDQDLKLEGIEWSNSPTSISLDGTPITMQRLAENEQAKAKLLTAQPATRSAGQREKNESATPRQGRSGQNKGKRSTKILESDEDESGNDHVETRQSKRKQLDANSTRSTPTRRSLRPRRQKTEADLRAERAVEQAIREALED